MTLTKVLGENFSLKFPPIVWLRLNHKQKQLGLKATKLSMYISTFPFNLFSLHEITFHTGLCNILSVKLGKQKEILLKT